MTLERLSRDGRRFNRARGAWLAIEDALCMSSPEGMPGNPVFEQLERWVYSTSVNGFDGVQRVTSYWKEFCSLVKHKSLQSLTPLPRVSRGFPLLDDNGELRKRSLGPLEWLREVFRRGCASKGEMTRVCHLASSRGLPPASGRKVRDSLREHEEVLLSEFNPEQKRVELVWKLARRIGRRVKALIDKSRRPFVSNGHVSLTSAASAESELRQGGRAAYVAADFGVWLEARSEESSVGSTIIGSRYYTIEGIPRWQTMCRAEPYHNRGIDGPPPIPEATAFANEREPTRLMPGLGFIDAKEAYTLPYTGIDDRIGLQLHQWSVEQAIAAGRLVGPPYGTREELRQFTVGLPASINRSAVCEPGGKARIVSAGESWLTIFLQPFGHQTVDLLSRLPQARAGLSAAYQCYEWVKSISMKETSIEMIPDLYFLSSDLKTATDYCCHRISAAMLRGFYEGLSLYDNHPYIETAISLLCSGRVFETTDGRKCLSKRATLMGDPGTKSVLTLYNLCAEEESFIRFTSGLGPDDDLQDRHLECPDRTTVWRHFACAGDDHLACGPLEYLKGITEAHSRNGMCVNWEMNLVSKLGAFYCEEAILRTASTRITADLRSCDYQDSLHVDALKVRLLSTYRKEVAAKPDDSSGCNPAVGKGTQFLRKLEWLPEGFKSLREVALLRFNHRMSQYLPSTEAVWQYLPRSLGGLGLPHLGAEPPWGLYADLLDPIHRTAIEQVLEGTADPWVERALSRFSSNDRARGIDLSNRLIEDEIVGSLKMSLSTVISFYGGVSDSTEEDVYDDEFIRSAAGIDAESWSRYRFRDRNRIAERCGYYSLESVYRLVERPYIFKQLLLGNIQVEGRFDLQPWRKRYASFISDLERLGVTADPRSETLDLSPEKTSKAFSRRRGLYIPMSRIPEELATLKVPIYRWNDRHDC